MQLIPDGPTHWKLLADVQHVIESYVDTVLRSDWEEGSLGGTEGDTTT